MSARKLSAGIGVAALAATMVTLTTGAATADPANPPVASDLVGVGSDTSQFALDYLADGTTFEGGAIPGYNAGRTSGFVRSFHATGGGTVVLQQGHAAVTRPNGSGPGKASLFNPSNADVDYARASSSLNDAEKSAGLQQIPFALDTLKMAVKKDGSKAPDSLTPQQIVRIYDGTYTNWSQVGGADGVIKPLIPQAGSGTRSFFEAQLKAANGNNAVVLGGAVTEAQEHDDTPIKNDVNAVAPFSAGRADLLGTLRLETGFTANRALYNVVRAADVDNADIQSVFGEDGFVCSEAGARLIAAAGFDQLATPGNGGVCGEPTQSATTNFATSETSQVSATLAGTSPAGRQVRLDATVEAGGVSPEGMVTFKEGDTTVGTAPVVARHAVLNLSNVAPGTHTYVATFAPADSTAYTGATTSSVNVVVKEVSNTIVSITAAPYGQSVKVQVNASSGGSPASPASGPVLLTVGSWKQTVTLSGTAVTVTLPKTLGAGVKSLVATYQGNATVAPSTVTGGFTVAKAGAKVTTSFKAKVKKGKKAAGVVTVALTPASTVLPTGKIVVKEGKKVVGSGTLANGKATIKLKKLKKGKHTLAVSYAGSADVNAASITVKVKQK